MDTNSLPPPRKKPGPVAGPPMGRYTVLIEEELGEWGKHQPGGLSETIRRLVRAERERQQSESKE